MTLKGLFILNSFESIDLANLWMTVAGSLFSPSLDTASIAFSFPSSSLEILLSSRCSSTVTTTTKAASVSHSPSFPDFRPPPPLENAYYSQQHISLPLLRSIRPAEPRRRRKKKKELIKSPTEERENFLFVGSRNRKENRSRFRLLF